MSCFGAKPLRISVFSYHQLRQEFCCCCQSCAVSSAVPVVRQLRLLFSSLLTLAPACLRLRFLVSFIIIIHVFCFFFFLSETKICRLLSLIFPLLLNQLPCGARCLISGSCAPVARPRRVFLFTLSVCLEIGECRQTRLLLYFYFCVDQSACVGGGGHSSQLPLLPSSLRPCLECEESLFCLFD